MVVVLENNNKDVTFGEPYFQELASYGMTLAQYHGMLFVRHSLISSDTDQAVGTTHPSQVMAQLTPVWFPSPNVIRTAELYHDDIEHGRRWGI